MPTLVEIGPSKASQEQHRRKDATEQIKNLTLAGSRTQVPGFSSADAITTMYIYSIYSIYVYIYIYSDLFFLHNCPLLIPLHNTAVLIKICRF